MKPSPSRAEKWLARAQRARSLADRPGAPRPTLLEIAEAYERLAARALGQRTTGKHILDTMEE